MMDMRALSPSTIALIDELYRLANERSWFRSRRSHTDAISSQLEKIAQAGEPFAIPRIISLTLDSRREVAEAAGQSVKRLRQLVGVRDLSAFDQAFRDLSPWVHPESARWREMQPTELRSVAALSSGPALLQLAMCHPSGYVREEAIRRSATSADGSEVAFLLLRANDWVKTVRQLAQAALRARLTPEHVPDLVGALPLLDAMHRWGRLGPTKLVDEIERLFCDPKAVPGLITALRSPDRFIRRGAYRRLFDQDDLAVPAEPEAPSVDHAPYRGPASTPRSKQEVYSAAMHDADPTIRAWAGHWLIAGDNVVFAGFADQLLRSPVSALRFGAAQRLLATGSQLPWSMLLIDPHGGVRALAQKAALDAGKDPDTEYRAKVSTSHGARLGIALVGLSETGGPVDVALVRSHLRSERPVVRKSALHALANFKVDDIVELALAALLDASPSVERVARDILLARITIVRGADVWSSFTRSTSTAGKRAALAVLSGLGYWESLPYLLRVFDASDELRARVQQHLVSWLAHQTRVFVSPSSSLASEISNLIRESKLPDSVRRQLTEVLEARVRADHPEGSPTPSDA